MATDAIRSIEERLDADHSRAAARDGCECELCKQHAAWRRAPVRFEIIPHPRYRGEWLLKPTRGAPFGLWYRERAHAVSYAEWVAREVDCAEIIVRNRDGSLSERLILERAAQANT